MSSTAPDARYLDGEWHRLHPATPLLRGGIAFVAIVFWLIANLRERLIGLLFGVPDLGRDPIDELGRHDLIGIAALLVAGVLILAVGLFWISWRASTFRIDGDAVSVRHGVLLRTTRTAKLDRIQGVTISRPLLPRLVGAARLELDVAGHDANVKLEYLSGRAAEALRADVLALASGARRERAEAVPGVPAAPEPPPLPDGPPLLAISPARAIGAVLLSQTTLVLVVVAVIAVVMTVGFGAGFAAAFSVFPFVVGGVTVGARRVGRNLRYSIRATPDGVRIASGIVSTSSEAVPPGRIHAVRIEQPLAWRPAGWWRVSVNRAGHLRGRRAADAERTLAPVATLQEVLALLGHLVPDLRDTPVLVVAGLTGSRRDGDFVPAPRRAWWLRPLSWRRTGFRLTDASLLFRSGVLRRELLVVPEARMQSVSLHRGPAERLLDVATVAPHVVAGPVRTRIHLVDRGRAEALFAELAATGAAARAADVSHRWADVRDAVPIDGPVAP